MTLAVCIFDTDNEGAVMVTSVEIVKERRTRISDM